MFWQPTTFLPAFRDKLSCDMWFKAVHSVVVWKTNVILNPSHFLATRAVEPECKYQAPAPEWFGPLKTDNHCILFVETETEIEAPACPCQKLLALLPVPQTCLQHNIIWTPNHLTTILYSVSQSVGHANHWYYWYWVRFARWTSFKIENVANS